MSQLYIWLYILLYQVFAIKMFLATILNIGWILYYKQAVLYKISCLYYICVCVPVCIWGICVFIPTPFYIFPFLNYRRFPLATLYTEWNMPTIVLSWHFSVVLLIWWVFTFQLLRCTLYICICYYLYCLVSDN